MQFEGFETLHEISQLDQQSKNRSVKLEEPFLAQGNLTTDQRKNLVGQETFLQTLK